MGFFLDRILGPKTLKTVVAARELLAEETPLTRDCGGLCGRACCQADETGLNGMLLYPFEHKLYEKPIEGFAYTLHRDDTLYKGGYRLVCEGHCPREHRPLACRMFPLRTRLTLDEGTGETGCVAELDPRAWAVCPLLEAGGLRAMREGFAGAVGKAGKLMYANTYLLEAMLSEQRLLDEMRGLLGVKCRL